MIPLSALEKRGLYRGLYIKRHINSSVFTLFYLHTGSLVYTVDC